MCGGPMDAIASHGKPRGKVPAGRGGRSGMTRLEVCRGAAGGVKSPFMKPALIATLVLSLPALAEFTVETDEKGARILEGGKPLTAYHVGRVPFVYPLPSASGANLARRWPVEEAAEGEEKDHPHHRSLWLSHGRVNGYDFWAFTGKGDPEIRHLATHDAAGGEDSATFRVDLEWRADGKRQLTEARGYRFHRPDPKTLVIDVTSRLTATDGPVVLGDTKEGTFAVRVDRTLRQKGPLAKGGILDSEGRRDGGCWGKRSKWVAFHGPDEKGEPAVIAMFDHPANLRYPTWWHARDYGLLAANPFGIHDFERGKPKGSGDHPLAAGETLEQRYRVVLHHGEVSAEMLEGIAADFARP